MATPPQHVDRRAQRTRQLLRQASIDVMREKGFTAMTIQDIADRANVNRGTFYAHFTDKYALLDELIHEQFHYLLARRLPPVARWDRRTLKLLIQIVLEHFADEYRECDPAEVVDPLLERAAQEELTRILLAWLKQGKSRDIGWRVPVEMIARVVSWAILGAAVHWGREPTTLSSEQVANDVLLVIVEGVARLAPDALPE
jgi:AcrR family transcriptional regulator